MWGMSRKTGDGGARNLTTCRSTAGMRLPIRRVTPAPSKAHCAAGLSENPIHRVTGNPSLCRTGSKLCRTGSKLCRTGSKMSTRARSVVPLFTFRAAQSRSRLKKAAGVVPVLPAGRGPAGSTAARDACPSWLDCAASAVDA